MTQQTQQISAHAYAITGQWRENESIYPESPHVSPYGLEPVYLDPFGEIPRMENLGVANDSGINETLANTPHLSMHEHTHSVALTNGASAGHTRLHNQEQYMETTIAQWRIVLVITEPQTSPADGKSLLKNDFENFGRALFLTSPFVNRWLAGCLPRSRDSFDRLSYDFPC